MKRGFIAIFGTHMFIEVFYLTHLALLPTFIEEFNLNLIEASLIATVPNLIVLLSYVPVGILADKVGVKPLLLASMIVEGLSALMISQIRDYAILLLLVSILRLSSPIYHTAGMSSLSQMADPSAMSKMVGRHNALGSLGTTIGLLSLSILGLTLGWRYVYLFWVIPILIWCVPILRIRVGKIEGEAGDDGTGGSSLKGLRSILTPAFTILLLIMGIRSLGISAISTYLTTYIVEFRGFSQEVASVIFGLGPLTGIFGALTGGHLSGRLGDRKSLMVVLLFSAISLIPLSMVNSLELILVTYIIYAFFNSAVWSPLGTLVAKLTPGSKRGLGYSSFFFTQGAISTIQPTVMAAIIGYTNLWIIFPIAITLFFTCTLILKLTSL